MNNKIPDFSSWLELESKRKVVLLKDGTDLMEIRSYRKITNDGDWVTGTAINFFGKEALKIWNIFISDEEIFFSALKIDNDKWEIGMPISKEESDKPNNNRVIIAPHVAGEKNPFIKISLLTYNGIIEVRILKNDPPPNP